MKNTKQATQENDTLKFFLNAEEFIIPSNFSSLQDVNPNILSDLEDKKVYHVKSNVKEDIFQNFINNWVYDEIPNIRYDNIVEYEQLSQEFDRMKDIIEIFKKKSPNTYNYSLICQKDKFLKKITKKSDELRENSDKYQKIISVLFNNFKYGKYFGLMSDKDKVYSSCKDQNCDLIELLCRKTIEKNGLLFSLNEKDKTATLFNYLTETLDIFIPRSVSYDSQEFVITRFFKNSFFLSQIFQSIQFSEDSELQSIDDYAFSNSSIQSIVIPSSVSYIGKLAFVYCQKLKSIEFSKSSQLKTIEKGAFSNSSIQYLSIPSSVELKEGVFGMTYNLTNVNIFSNNKIENITLFNNDFILGKSDTKSDIFDILLFARRNIEIAKIPSFVKEIASFAFQSCNKLKSIEFSEDSELELIGKGSFYGSSIENILIPKKVTHILSFAFSQCKALKTVLFAENSKLKSIEKATFSYSSIEKVSIPSDVVFIGKNAFFNCRYLKEIDFIENSNLKSIGNKAFSRSIIESFTFPSSIEEFKEDWCLDLLNLNSIKILSNEKQNISLYNNDFLIGKTDQKSDIFEVLLFARRDIEIAIVPHFITKIAKNAFQNCNKLKTIEFPNDSKLKYIENHSFSGSSIENFIIPNNVEIIKNFAFYQSKVKKIEFSQSSKLTEINEEAFSNSMIENITIPSNITQISKRTFYQCSQLKNVTFSEQSKLKSIGKCAFYESSIEFLSIPSSVVVLKKGWCHNVLNLNKIEIMKNKVQNFIEYNNELIIGKSEPGIENFDVIVFAIRNIKNITIPSFIKRIGPFSFQYCTKLKNVKFEENSELISIDQKAFDNSSIEKIEIPSHVTQIQKFAFSNCNHLKKVEFTENSELETIEKYAFARSSIEKFNLPLNAKIIGEGAFELCNFLNVFTVPEKSKLNVFDKYSFMKSSISSIFIPQFANKVDIEAFAECFNLKIIEISENLNLKEIDVTEYDELDLIIMVPSRLRSSFNLILDSLENT